jgi:hypothetical protein
MIPLRLICFFSMLFSVLPAGAESPASGEFAALKKAAFRVDQQIAAFYRSKNLQVPAVTDDATFMRRAFLVAVGRIPTAEEALDFIEIDDPTKRELLISYLLGSEGYSSHMSNWVFDLLRVSDVRNGSAATNTPYRHWVREAVAANIPWDQFATRLLSATGDGWDKDTAAVGYYTRDFGMPLDNLSNTMRIFLGKRMECAQCHDDPFGETERHDFYELAAFTHDQGAIGDKYMSSIYTELVTGEKYNTDEYHIGRMLWDSVYGLSLAGDGAGRIALPPDYQYRDGKPGDIIAGKTPFGKMVRMSDRKDKGGGRKELADWMVNKTDAQFAAVIANRMWKRVMGKGVIEPADEYVEAKDTNHPELVKLLSDLMHELKYDLRAFQQVLLLTKTFQFATNPNASVVEGGDDFHGRKIERLSAEQIWDSLITLADGDPDLKPRKQRDDRIKVAGRPVLAGKKSMPQLSKEVLALQSEGEVRSYFNKLVEEIRSDSSSGSGESMMSMNAVVGHESDPMVRASELPSPAPRDHFLYVFGASDREVVDGASKAPNVGQVLSLMNGFVQDQLVNRSEAHLYKSLEGVTSDAEKVRRLYLAILNRSPKGDEMDLMVEELKTRGDEGCRNVVSCLVMSSEFLFLQ